MVKTIVFTILLAILLLTGEVACGQCVGCAPEVSETTVIKHPTDTCKAEITMKYTLVGVNCTPSSYSFHLNGLQEGVLTAHGCTWSLGSSTLEITCPFAVPNAHNVLTITDAFKVKNLVDSCLFDLEWELDKEFPSATITDNTCSHQQKTGRIAITAMDGSSVEWKDGVGPDARYLTGDSCRSGCLTCEFDCWAIKNLAPGRYIAVVTDTFGCKRTVVTDLTGSVPPHEIKIDSMVKPLCSGDLTGYIRLRVLWEGSPPADPVYSWQNFNNPATIGTDTVLTSLGGGRYLFHVGVEGSPCIQTHYIPFFGPLPVRVEGTITHPICAVGASGAITSFVYGGTLPFTYAWSNMATTAHLTGVAGGLYTLTVTDAHGCTGIGAFTLVPPDALEPEVLTVTNVGCHGDSSGKIYIQPRGGTPYKVERSMLPFPFYQRITSNYDYRLYRNDTLIRQQDKKEWWKADSLKAGTYFLEVEDSLGCVYRDTLILTQPPVLTATLILEGELNCNNPCQGILTGTGDGGVPPYQYALLLQSDDPGLSRYVKTQELGDMIQLTRLLYYGTGDYILEIKDANGCVAVSAPVTVDPPTRDYNPAYLRPCVSCETCEN